MTAYRFIVLAACAALAACAQEPSRAPQDEAPAAGEARPPRVVVAKPEPSRPPLPGVELSEELLFKVMLAEVALQRGQPHIAVQTYLELARETRDPRIAQRATEVAWNARFSSAALEAAGIWLQADPGSAQARQLIAALLVNQARLADAQPHLEKWIAADRASVGQSFIQLSSLLARHKDKTEVLNLMQALAKPYPGVPEARLAVAQAAWNAENQEVSLDEARAALKLRPGWEVAALFVAQVLQRRSNEEALRYLGEYLQDYPGARDARLNYARLLVTAKNYPGARQQFEVLVGEYPQNADVGMAVALLAIQATDYDAAETQLKRVLELNYKDPDVARFYLGQLNEERKRFDEAARWYLAVEGGEQFVPAHARYAFMLARQNRVAEARAHLQTLQVQNEAQRVQIVQAEAQLMREAKAYKESYDILKTALDADADNPDLLYDIALAAEKLDRIDVAETSLRRLIALKPDHAQAYNALGYTLADRTDRLAEARDYIEKALKLLPEDPFILDSMGWVEYRLGNHAEGLQYLQRAFDQRPDPEIAAHLGEVLWAKGKKGEAEKVWRDSLRDNPGNEELQKVIKKFLP